MGVRNDGRDAVKQQILFIGNSHTYFWHMPEEIFVPMAKEAGLDCEVLSVTEGDCPLWRFADENDPVGQRLRQTVTDKRFDIVVLQCHCLTPVQQPEKFFDGVAALRDLLERQTERFVLYVPWGRKEGHPDLEKLNMSSEEMTETIARRNDEAAGRFGMETAHAGRAFVTCRREHPEEELYFRDGQHASPLGSRLAARTILQVVMK